MSSAADSKLPERVEKLLAEMPVTERDWEALAVRSVERAMTATETPANLLDPPLPPEEGEAGFERKEPAVAAQPAIAAPKAAPVSLAELARASVKKKNESAKDIALESLAVATQARAQVDEIAERVQAATRQARPSVPDVEPVEQVEPIAESSKAPTEPAGRRKKPAQEPAAAPVPAVAAQARASRGPWIVSGFAVLAAAAAIAISVKPKDEPAPLAVTPSVEVAPKSVAHAPLPADPTSNKPAAEPNAAAEPEPQAVPLPPPEAARVAQGPAAAPKSGGAPAPAGSSAGVKPEAIELEEEDPATAPAPAPAPSPKMVPAELPRTGLPDKPSAGAAYAAIGPFMGSARACVAGHDDPSTARIVFSSDGSVQSVSVSGPAAGTAAAACIEGAFKKARVQPFAAPTFSMSTVVRPQ